MACSASSALAALLRVGLHGTINTGVPVSAACEQLFTVGEDVFSAKQPNLSDKNFERLLICRVRKRFCPDI